MLLICFHDCLSNNMQGKTETCKGQHKTTPQSQLWGSPSSAFVSHRMGRDDTPPPLVPAKPSKAQATRGNAKQCNALVIRWKWHEVHGCERRCRGSLASNISALAKDKYVRVGYQGVIRAPATGSWKGMRGKLIYIGFDSILGPRTHQSIVRPIAANTSRGIPLPWASDEGGLWCRGWYRCKWEKCR